MAPTTWCLQFQNVLGTSSFTSSDVSPPLHHLLRLAKGGLDMFPVCRLHCSVQSANQVKGEAKRLFVWSLCGMGERGDASWSLPSGSPFSGQLWGLAVQWTLMLQPGVSMTGTTKVGKQRGRCLRLWLSVPLHLLQTACLFLQVICMGREGVGVHVSASSLF